MYVKIHRQQRERSLRVTNLQIEAPPTFILIY